MCSNRRMLGVASRLLTGLFCLSFLSLGGADARLKGAVRNAQTDGWIYVHLEGTPSEIGFQHGFLLTREIEDAKRAIELSSTHEVEKKWNELRTAAHSIFWPHLPTE